ncbi:extracellular calcium-sensing receptor-like [Pleurodeles waltl]|uniref:extracellular calcium-sensing receptor-like n=1 Tax=Pleurodeles waltl TaxID=8319 RepID=UPI0037094F63
MLSLFLPALLLSVPPRVCGGDAPSCFLHAEEEDGYEQDGDIQIGGIFPVTFHSELPVNPFMEPRKPDDCKEFSPNTYRWVQAMTFSINEINKDQTLLPNITLGFRIFDTCASIRRNVVGTMWMLTGKRRPLLNFQCQSRSVFTAVIGGSQSTSSLAMARLLGLYQIPQVSYFASSPLLSNKIQFPSFLRTIPSDHYQAYGLVKLVLHFGWKWVGLLSAEDDYGVLGSQVLKESLLASGVCIAFHETLPSTPSTSRHNVISNIVKTSSANVVVAFSAFAYLKPVLWNIVNLTGKIWIASEAWSTITSIFSKDQSNMMTGTLGLATRDVAVPGMQEFFINVHPLTSLNDIFSEQFWEETFGCHWKSRYKATGASVINSTRWCTGAEKPMGFELQNTNKFDQRVTYNIYNALYAVAHALHKMHSCVPGGGPFINNRCANLRDFRPWQLLRYIRDVHFVNSLGEEMYFDVNGDPPGLYDVVNWHEEPDGTLSSVKVGSFDSRAPPGHELSINAKAIQWNMKQTEVPCSVCSESCNLGFRKALQKGRPSCCFDCISCAVGEISNETDSSNCGSCPDDKWSNEERSECVPKRIEYLSYWEPLGSILAASGIACSMTTMTTLCIFIKYQDTPVVKANNRKVTYIFLGALALSFLCSIFFIGEPQPLTCLLRQPSFGIIFALCVSCILAKTIMVVIAFNATKPGSNMRKWLGPQVPMATVSLCTLSQFLICAMWLLICPPYPEKNLKVRIGTIILQCNECSKAALWCMLGYMGLLACVSFLVAFLARKLPSSFNEAKWITFSMLIFLSVWLSFVPGYLSTQGKYMVAVEVFGIISSSAGLFTCIFLPKCYIILLRPALNTKEHLLGKSNTEKTEQKTEHISMRTENMDTINHFALQCN